jgi:hypothetical protein
MSYEESYAKAFPFAKLIPGMLAPKMIDDTAKIIKKATKDKVRMNLFLKNRCVGDYWNVDPPT